MERSAESLLTEIEQLQDNYDAAKNQINILRAVIEEQRADIAELDRLKQAFETIKKYLN